VSAAVALGESTITMYGKFCVDILNVF